jgi:hypothetical protein
MIVSMLAISEEKCTHQEVNELMQCVYDYSMQMTLPRKQQEEALEPFLAGPAPIGVPDEVKQELPKFGT